MSDTMESIKSHDDESVVIVTPAEPATPAETEVKEEEKKTGEEKKSEDDKKKDDEAKKDDESESSSDEEEEKKEKIIVGIVSESKDLYAKYDQNGDQSWTDKLPDDLEEAAENEETQKYAVIIRNKKPKVADSTKPLVIDSIIIQSPFLKRVLAKVFDGYPGIVTDMHRLLFQAPFQCFVHRWDKFEEVRADTTLDEITREHVELLYKIMKGELEETIQRREDYFKNRAVDHEYVWTLFPPGCTVYGSKHGKPVALKYSNGYYVEMQCGKVFVLECKVLDWDGNLMGWTTLNQQIPEFLGTMPFTSLPCFPLEFHPRLDAAKAALLQRGLRFEELADYCYKAYKGTAIYHIDSRKMRKETVQSRIVIDGANWEKLNPEHTVWIDPIHETNYDSDDEDISKLDNKRPALTEEQLIMTYPMVRGYSLKNKRWMEFFIDSVTEVKFNDQAFDSLVLPQDQKELILAFAQSQVKYKDTFDDIISGKGKGIIMLLSGGPGIGKTLTAESVAEEMKVPLYIMSAGDLGSEADEVEENLSRILNMVANWNAVLLLDECDVFLEARSAHDIARNRIVSIFLRTLEYYEGILFLTTNRVKNMDPAFQSRIHMSLEYPPLDYAARAAVWKGFLNRAVGLDAKAEGRAAHEITEEEAAELARLDLNGRQIKNVLKTANLLACHKGEKLAFKHLRTVLKVEGHSL